MTGEVTSRKLINLGLDRKYWITVGLIAIVYILAAKLGLSLAFTTKQVTTVWPATGIAQFVILVLGYRYWPGILAGAFIANLLTHELAWVALFIAVGNTLEALVAAYLLKRVAHFKNSFDDFRDIVAFFVLAGLISTMVSATIGTLSLAASSLITWQSFFSVWRTWWVGDMMGSLLVAPFLLACMSQSSRRLVKKHKLETGLMLALLLLISWLTFTGRTLGSFSGFYLLFPFLSWAAIRFTLIGVTSSAIIIAGTAVWAIVNSKVPLVRITVEQALIQLQLFVLVISLTSVISAVAVQKMFATEASLQRQARKLERANTKILKENAERKRLEVELKAANKRATDILAGVLNDGASRRSKDSKAEVDRLPGR